MPVTRSRAPSRRETLRCVALLVGLGALMLVLLVVGTIVLERYLSNDLAQEASARQVDDLTAPLTPAQLGGAIDYVALGDSYSAGPGLPTQTDEACRRSDSNYPALLGRMLGAVTVTDVTCAGARTVDMGAEQVRAEGQRVPPQLDAITRDTDLVTLSVGGNDDNAFVSIVTTCPRVAADDPQGTPCQQTLVGTGDAVLERQTERLTTRVAAVIQAVRARAPRAQVVVVGYPSLFPTNGTCRELPFAAGDVTWAARVVDAVVEGLKAAARNEGVRFVDLRIAGAGHDICADEPWMTGSEPGKDGVVPWHPRASGMQGAAAAIYTQLSGRGEPAIG